MELHSQSISGTWLFSGGNIELTLLLNDNGTGEFQGSPIKYTIQNRQLYIDDGISPVAYNYQLSNNTLILTGGGMQVPVTFTRPGVSSQTGSQNGVNQNSQATSGVGASAGTGSAVTGLDPGKSGISGVWEGSQGKIVFYPDGIMLYNNTSYSYSLSANQIVIGGSDGNMSFGYSQTGNTLNLSLNGSSSQYTRTSTLRNAIVDPQLAGKWCVLSSNYNNYSGGGSSSEECITLNADGTYTYFFSASRSGYSYGQTTYGGTSNQNGDKGTWKCDGLTIVSVSSTTGKTSRYTLSKENNENGDPIIVIGGKKFVTAYQRQGW